MLDRSCLSIPAPVPSPARPPRPVPVTPPRIPPMNGLLRTALLSAAPVKPPVRRPVAAPPAAPTPAPTGSPMIVPRPGIVLSSFSAFRARQTVRIKASLQAVNMTTIWNYRASLHFNTLLQVLQNFINQIMSFHVWVLIEPQYSSFPDNIVLHAA